jgi:hypothetical protein
MLPGDVQEGHVYQMRDGRPYPLPNIKRLDTTMRPMPDTVGDAIERAQDKIDYDAADIGVAAVVLAEAINPGGSKAGRERLVDEITTPAQAFKEGYEMGLRHAERMCELDMRIRRIAAMTDEIQAMQDAGQPKVGGL